MQYFTNTFFVTFSLCHHFYCIRVLRNTYNLMQLKLFNRENAFNKILNISLLESLNASRIIYFPKTESVCNPLLYALRSISSF